MNKLKLTILSAVLCFTSLFSMGQDISWIWANSASSDFFSRVGATAIDNNGNTYAAGQFAGGDLVIDLLSATSVINSNGYLAKFNPLGEAVWILPLGSEGITGLSIYTIGVDSQGDVIVCGQLLSFMGESLSVGDLTLDTSLGAAQAFLLKVDTDGEPQWIRSLVNGENPTQYTSIANITFDSEDNFSILGTYLNSVQLGGLTLDSNGSYDVFLAKGNSDGEFDWAQSIGGLDIEKAADLTLDSDNNIFVSGTWAGDTLHIGDHTLVNDQALVGANFDRWIAKFNSEGTAEWAVRESGPESELGAELAATMDGGVMTHSKLLTAVDIQGNAIPVGGSMITQYTMNGELVFAQKLCDGDVVIPFEFAFEETDELSLATDGADNFYFGVTYNSAQNNIGTTVLNNAGTDSGTFDFALIKTDVSGNVLWAENLGDIDNETLTDIVISPSNMIVIGGYHSSSDLSFGEIDLTYNGINSSLFVASFDGATGISDLESSTDIRVYPNPCSDILSLKLDDLNDTQVNISIHSFLGQTVLQTSKNFNSSINLNVEALSPGMYFVEISNATSKWNTKFLKQ